MSFTREKERLGLLLDEMERALSPHGFATRLAAAKERLGRETMNLLIVGEFSRGKSTFINALLGMPVLPSKVNPTTATINTIVPGQERSMRIRYHDGRIETAALPESQINKYLEEIVTVANKDAPTIHQVTLTLPGPMEGWNCTIVDTPGVNELDDTREEITYQYLKQADACIVLLDAQPPLSESERRFIQDKVMGNDVNRLVYVVNRIDEVEKTPDGPVSARLIAYARGLLVERFPNQPEPLVFALSAKEALRARFKKEASPWLDAFIRFETQLEQFLSRHARRGRLPEHAERAAGIAADALRMVHDRLALTQGSAEELAARVARLEEEERHLRLQLQGMNDWFEHQTGALTRRIQGRIESGFDRLRAEWVAQAEACEDESDFIALKSAVASGVRGELENLMEEVQTSKLALAEELQQRFAVIRIDGQADMGASAGLPALRRYAPAASSGSGHGTNPVPYMRTADGGEGAFPVAIGAFAAGSVLGYVGMALLGPIGLAAAAVGSFFLGKRFGEERDRAAREKARQEAVRQMRAQLDEAVRSASDNAERMARNELEPMKQYYRDVAQARIDSITRTIEAQRSGLRLEGSSLAQQKAEWEALTAKLQGWLKELEFELA